MRIGLSLAFTAAIALACGSCGDSLVPDPSALTILFQSDDYVLGPSRDDTPKFLMFEPLVRSYGAMARPNLAERWEHSADFRTWTYHLRDDVRWHDGVPVTAHDVAFTLDLFRHPDVLFHGFPQAIDTIAVPDDHTLVLRFKRPYRDALPGWPVYYPKHLLEDLDPERFFDWEFWKHPVGNGPYRYRRGVANTMQELEANPDYFLGRPPIDRVVLRLSTANLVTELVSGNVDAAYYVAPADIQKLTADPRFQVHYRWVFSEPQAIHWNQRHPFLRHATVRRALSHAVDRRELARLLSLPDGMPLVGGLSPSDRAGQLYRAGRLDPGPTFDPDLAARLLDQAGWVDSDGDGVRDRDGVPAAFTLLARRGGILSTLEPAVLLQARLRTLGVAMELRPMESVAYWRLYRAGDFDATINDVRNDPFDLLRSGFFADGTVIGYRNPEIVGLLESVTTTVDPESEDSLYTSINRILDRDMPVTFLFPYYEAYAAHRKVRGLSTPDAPDPVTAIMHLRVEEEP
jgi:peptide/nickel transport system substrate-binding protein